MTDAPRTGRRRSDAARQAILAAAFAILEEQGFSGLSIEGVASRAGVGKTTIYRWWSSKGVLAVDAFLAAVGPRIAFNTSPSAATDLRRQMLALAALYNGPTGRFVREMIGSSQTDAAMHQAFIDGFLAPRRQAAREVVLRGMAIGEFSKKCDADIAIDILYAPIYYRLLTSGDPLNAQFVNAVADLALPALAAPP